MGTMGNSFGMGVLGAMMMPYNMQMYEYQTQMYLIFGLLIFMVLMCCCCGCFALCYCVYMKDEDSKRRREEARQDARKDEMGLKQMQITVAAKRDRQQDRERPRYVRHDS